MIHNLDVTQEHCPMTFVKTKIALNKLQPGDVLNVQVTEGEPLENVPKSAVEQGYAVLSVTKTDKDGVYTIEIMRIKD